MDANKKLTTEKKQPVIEEIDLKKNNKKILKRSIAFNGKLEYEALMQQKKQKSF